MKVLQISRSYSSCWGFGKLVSFVADGGILAVEFYKFLVVKEHF